MDRNNMTPHFFDTKVIIRLALSVLHRELYQKNGVLMKLEITFPLLFSFQIVYLHTKMSN